MHDIIFCQKKIAKFLVSLIVKTRKFADGMPQMLAHEFFFISIFLLYSFEILFLFLFLVEWIAVIAEKNKEASQVTVCKGFWCGNSDTASVPLRNIKAKTAFLLHTKKDHVTIVALISHSIMDQWQKSRPIQQ